MSGHRINTCTKSKRMDLLLGYAEWKLGFTLGFGLKFDVAFREFDRVFDSLAVILLADLLSLFLHEGRKRIDTAGDTLTGLFLCRDQSVVQALDLLPLSLIHAMQDEVRSGSGGIGCGPSSHSVGLGMLGLHVVGIAYALN